MKAKIFLILIIFLGFLLRVWQIDKFPKTLYGDEQAFAWNAYNILKLGQDEYGNPYPLQFKSFDDYKAPIPVYLLVPFLKVWGMNIFSIRLPIVIAGTITVFVTYFLSRLFFSKKIALLATFLMAVSPWHVHLSRGFFESTLSLLWLILGIFLIIKGKDRFSWLSAGMIFFALSIYSYFTPRILVPILLIFLGWYNKVYSNSSTSGESSGYPRGVLTTYLLPLVFLMILSLPLLRLTFFDKGFSRFAKLTETNKLIAEQTVNRERNASNLPTNWRVVFHNKVIVWLRLVKNNYLEHLSPNFWYIYGDNSLRYFTGNMGMFYLLEFPFLLVGIYFLLKEKRGVAILSLGWIILAAIPASLVGRPFAVRSLAMLPAPFFIVGYGIYKLMHFSPSRSPFGHLEGVAKRLLPGVVTFGFILSLGTLLIRYYLEYPVYAATWWGWENKAALDYAAVRESQYDNIFISDFYTGATLAFAVYNQYDPLTYRYAVNNPVTLADGRSLVKLGKYYFGSLDINRERLSQNIIPPRSLYIGRPEEADSSETINAPDDGRIIFKIYKTN